MLGFKEGALDLVKMKPVKSRDCNNRVPSRIRFKKIKSLF